LVDHPHVRRLVRPGAEARKIELTRLFVRYAGDLSSGALEPRSISRQIDVTPPRPDLARLLERAAGASDIRAFLDGIAPSDPAYDRLLELRRDDLKEIQKACPAIREALEEADIDADEIADEIE
jgi:murein L,D-transpeptidase YcbB/YkuD